MKLRIEYTIEVTDKFRRAINLYWSHEGLATVRAVSAWKQQFGLSLDKKILAILDEEEPGVWPAKDASLWNDGEVTNVMEDYVKPIELDGGGI